MPLIGLPLLLFVFASLATGLVGAERPNILWLTSEDNSPYLGCYGDAQARTPHLDRLAVAGVRYRNAFSSSPVCSVARSTLISMHNATTLGLHNHRSSVAIPPQFKPYPAFFRAAGYYCTNWTKTDYNVAAWKQAAPLWDDLSKNAHYRNRRPGQPFFAVFNSMTSHEGQLTDQVYARRRKAGEYPPERVVAPEKIVLPPYHPDTPVIREDWSRYYDNLYAMDAEIGARLAELDASGEADNTIVFYYADHGGALARGKRDMHDSGTRVPLIIRFGKNFAHLAPVAAGGWVDQPVAFVDFAVTAMNLCGIKPPDHSEGKAFLGPDPAPPRAHVYLFRGRMDERYDTARAIRSERYAYIRHFSPHRSYGQQYDYAWRVQHNSASWFAEFTAGRCNAAQASYWLPKPSEELYEIAKDPYQIHNLAADPAYAPVLAAMRSTLLADFRASHDTGLVPEGMQAQLVDGKTLYEYVRSSAYPAEQVLATACAATTRDIADLPTLVAAMEDAHPVVRYWGAQGCLVLGAAAKAAEPALRLRLTDAVLSVRIAAAEALAHMGAAAEALPVLEAALASSDHYEQLEAANAIERGAADGVFTKEQASACFRRVPVRGEAKRLASALLGDQADSGKK